MERKMKTKATDKIKTFFKNNSDVIIGVCVSLTVGVSFGYEIGRNRGIRTGRNNILTEIVEISCKEGLVMTNPEMGSYIFTAKKLDK